MKGQGNTKFKLIGQNGISKSLYHETSGNILTIAENENARTRRTKLEDTTSLSTGFNQPMTNNFQLYQPWGADNNFPLHWLKMLDENPIVWSLINKIVDFVTGKKYVLYRERLDKGKIIVDYIPENENTEIWQWLDDNDWQFMSMKVIKDWAALGKAVVEFNKSKSGNKIASINHIDTTLHRIGKFEYLPITHKFADWQYGLYNAIEVNAIDEKNPLAFDKSILQLNSYSPGSYRYTKPFYIGAENSIKLHNKIPLFHLGGLTNGYLPRFHIQLPADYFLGEEDEDLAEQNFISSIDEFFSNAANSGKNFLTYFDTDTQSGKMKEGVKIEPIKAELYDDAFATIFDQAMISITSAIGMNAELAGVVMQGGMSGNSGSGIRNAYNQYVNLTVPTMRDYTLNRIFKIVQRANGWDRTVKLGYIDHQIEKLDENPTANKQGINTNSQF